MVAGDESLLRRARAIPRVRRCAGDDPWGSGARALGAGDGWVVLAAQLPDLLGSVTAYFDDGEFTELAYFATEEAARDGEQRAMSKEAADAFVEWSEVMLVERYLDLTEPWLITA